MKEKGLDTTLPSSFLGLECGTVPSDGEERIRLIGERKDVYLSFGAGPWCTGKDSTLTVKETILSLEKDIERYNADAVGECGFDFHWNYGSIEEEEALFSAQAAIARSLSVPLIIHSRDADEVLLRHLDEINGMTIMHCFSSSPEVMMKLLERGAYISFAGNVTYKGNDKIRESAILCPGERILYETDSPYLTPVPGRGKPNRPENTELTLAFLSELRNEEPSLIKQNAVRNFLSLMKNRESVVRRDNLSREV